MLTKDVIMKDCPDMSEGLMNSIMKAYNACREMQQKQVKVNYPKDITPSTAYVTDTLCNQLAINDHKQRIVLARIIQRYGCTEGMVNRALYIAKYMDTKDVFGAICGVLKSA